ncbi:MAG: glycosyltransferase family 4 protein [Ferruginibacter sp.]|nr:glycosyltransferase family 4 protein [Cytophagales bacterium]
MKTLMSAYQCEPDRGSEFEVGWQIMRSCAASCSELTVVTRSLSRHNSEPGIVKLGIRNTRFIYYDLPPWLASREGTLLGGQIVPYCWEIGLFFFLLRRYKRNQFDLAHRATVGSYRFPSLLWYFSRQFTWGPMASGEVVPFRLLSVLSWKGRVLEVVRMLVQHLLLLDPLVLLSLYKADKITVVTSATKKILPGFARRKATVIEYLIIDAKDFTVDLPLGNHDNDHKLKLLYAGRILEWKGIMFVLKALKQLRGKLDYEFNVVGDGPDRDFLQEYVRKHQLKVNFLGRKPRGELSTYYLTHHVFVGTDLHGRGSNAIIEAKMHQLPVLLLDISYPDEQTGKDLNIVIDTQRKSVNEIIENITVELLALQKKAASKNSYGVS